ncbi:MAG TPA: hypothetical protein VF590_18330, partial [Isosphaeraceae bacterium]
MDAENPYRPPRNPAVVPRRGEPAMTAARAFAIIIASGLGCSVAGPGLGYLLGRVAPAYYRGVFAGGPEPGFDLVQVGLGLGFSCSCRVR